MSRTFQRSFPAAARQLEALGQRLMLARRRRKISTTLMAERLGVSRTTLSRVEAGDPNTAIGTYLRALRVLGLEKDIDAVARDDELGRKLQDLETLGPAGNATTARPREVTATQAGSEDGRGDRGS
jgi:transcriptional regulator with XRE-family HTH domain